MSEYIEYFNELISSGSVFWFCALAGTGMFLIQFALNMSGLVDHDHFDMSDTSFQNHHQIDIDPADIRKFKWLSMQTITGFLMVFGWAAITCQSEFALQTSTTIGVSLAAGILAALVIRFVFRIAKKLMSSGDVFQIEETIGKEAYVYQRIPKGGVGKISMTLQNFTHEINAISRHREELSSFVRVKIIGKIDNNTVVVTPL